MTLAADRSAHESTRSPIAVLRSLATPAALVAASYAFRLPALVNARSTNSDAAVVGLQALHVLRGEWSPFLWGSGYQTSADSVVAALFFCVLGSTPLALMLSSLTLHVIATYLVFATLRRHVSPVLSLVLTLPLVFAPASVHTYALYPPRQAAITLALAAFWAIDGASRGTRRRATWLAFGGALATGAVAADPYPLLLAPLAASFALLVAWSGAGASKKLRETGALFASFVGGAAAGLVPFLLLRHAAGAKGGPLGLTTSMIGHHFDLLVRECLPWALSYKVYYAPTAMDYRPWSAPLAVRAVQIAGAIGVGAIVIYGFVGQLRRDVPAGTRRLGLVGAATYPLAIAAFLVSVMVMDHFSMRYLAVLTLMLPFAAVTAARVWGPSKIALVLAPHLVASAINGWLGYGPFVRGAIPVTSASDLASDHALGDLLRARGVKYAVADYWASYRLTLLFHEEIVVVPLNPAEDRYAPYRRAYERAPVFAYVFDHERSREDLAASERALSAANAHVEKLAAGNHRVLVVTR